MATRLVDIDATVRIIASEVEAMADDTDDAIRERVRDDLAALVRREVTDEAATVAVIVTVRSV